MIIKASELELVLNELKDFLEIELPIETSIKISQLIEILMDRYSIYYKTKKEILSRFSEGKTDTEGNIIIPKDKIDEFKKEYDALNESEVIITEVEPISIIDLPKEVKVSPRKIAILLKTVFTK